MINSAKATWLTSRGNAYAQRHELDQAIKDFKEALQLEPARVPTMISLGMACVGKEMFKEAIGVLEKADITERDSKASEVLEYQPYLFHISNQNLHHALGIAYMKIDDKEKAIDHFEKSLKAAETLKNGEGGRIIKGQDAMNCLYIIETTEQFLKQLKQG